MQSENHETYIRKYNYVDSLSCYEKNEARYFNQTKRKLKKNDLSQEKCGFLTIWLIIHRLFLDVYVPLSFATIVDVHIRANRSANPCVPLETTTNNSKPFRQGLWSHLLHQLILVGAAAYWQLSHLLPANVRDALAGHDELQDVHAQQGLDAGLAPTALHSGTPSCPPILVRRTEAAASCETRRHILSQSQFHKSDMATKSVAKNDVCGFNLEQRNP